MPSPHEGPDGGSEPTPVVLGVQGGVWSQSPAFGSSSGNVPGSLALSNKRPTEAAVLLATHRVPGPALQKHCANIPQPLSPTWGSKEAHFTDERAEAQRGEVICLRSHRCEVADPGPQSSPF